MITEPIPSEPSINKTEHIPSIGNCNGHWTNEESDSDDNYSLGSDNGDDCYGLYFCYNLS